MPVRAISDKTSRRTWKRFARWSGLACSVGWGIVVPAGLLLCECLDAMTQNERRRPTLADVAQIAGVGNATVSRVLNGGKNVGLDTARRIEEAIRELGFKPNRAARRLKGASSGVVGMIVPSISDMFFSRCAEAVEEVVRQNGAMLIVSASQNSPRALLDSFQQLLHHDIEGLVLVPTQTQEDALHEALLEGRVPVVGIDRPLFRDHFSSVLCANFDGARQATEHLLQHGYASIVMMQVNPRLYTLRERARGYKAAMEQAHRTPVTLTLRDLDEAKATLREQLGLASQRPVGVFAGNNLTARYVVESAVALRLRIPDDLALIGFDDFDLSEALTPPMSVIEQPVDLIGREAAKLLFEQLREGNTLRASPKEVVLPVRLILRGSCGCH